MRNLMNTADVKTYLLDLQARIVTKLESLDGKPFGTDAWTRHEGGGGISRIIEEGNLFERAGVLFSHVIGTKLPPSAPISPIIEPATAVVVDQRKGTS